MRARYGLCSKYRTLRNKNRITVGQTIDAAHHDAACVCGGHRASRQISISGGRFAGVTLSCHFVTRPSPIRVTPNTPYFLGLNCHLSPFF